MNSSFKPWLGGDTKGRWSNHYELLGIPAGFDDTETIGRIADILLQRLQTAKTSGSRTLSNVDKGPKIAAVQEARDCLTNVNLRAKYDRSLGLTTNRPTQTALDDTVDHIPPLIPTAIPTAIPISAPIVNPTTNTSVPLRFETRRTTQTSLRRQRSSRSWLTIATLVFGTLLFAALVLLGKRLLVDRPPAFVAGNQPLPDSKTPTTASSSNGDPVVQAPKADPMTTSPQSMGAQSKGAQSMGAQTPTAATSNNTSPHAQERSTTPPFMVNDRQPQTSEKALDGIDGNIEPLGEKEIELLSKALKEIPIALSSQRFARATKALSIAEEIATHPEHGRLVSASADLVHYATEYWRAFDDAWKDLSSGSELVVGSTRVNVIDVNENRITLRVAGTNRRYQRGELPAGLQQAIVNHWLTPNAASTKLIVGAFWATRSAGDANDDTSAADQEKATELWNEAKSLGGPAGLLLSTIAPAYEVSDLRKLESTP